MGFGCACAVGVGEEIDDIVGASGYGWVRAGASKASSGNEENDGGFGKHCCFGSLEGGMGKSMFVGRGIRTRVGGELGFPTNRISGLRA